MPRTSNKADMIMDYVNHFIQENGYAPSVREICEAVHLKSTSSVHSHLETLEKNGEYIGGDGRCRIVLNSLSGDVFIRKVSQA